MVGSGRPPAGGGLGVPLGPGGIDLPAIIAAVATAATSPSVAAAAPLAHVLSLLKLLHLRFIYGVATDADIPWIWLEVCQVHTKASTPEVLSQYMWAGREVCRRDFFGSADMMHVFRDLFMFVHGYRFVNTKHDPYCPAGGMSFCTTC